MAQKIKHLISDRLQKWFQSNGQRHRTTNNGTAIVCPRLDEKQPGFPTVELKHRPAKTTVCPKCGQQLIEPELIRAPEDRKEFQWKNAA